MPYGQISRVALRNLLLARLGAASTSFWRTDELNRYIQESIRVWNSLTGFWKGRVSITTSPGTYSYVVPGGITSSLRVSWRDFQMTGTDWQSLDWGHPSWQFETTTTGGNVPSQPLLWCPMGLTKIGIWPSDALGNNLLVMDGVALTPVLTNDASDLDIGQEEVNALLDYCEHIALFKEGGAEFESTLPLFKNFLKMASTRNAKLMASAKYRMAMGLDESRENKRRELRNARIGAR